MVLAAVVRRSGLSPRGAGTQTRPQSRDAPEARRFHENTSGRIKSEHSTSAVASVEALGAYCVVVTATQANARTSVAIHKRFSVRLALWLLASALLPTSLQLLRNYKIHKYAQHCLQSAKSFQKYLVAPRLHKSF